MDEFDQLPTWLPETLRRTLVLQATTSRTENPLRVAIVADGDVLTRIEEVIMGLYQNPLRVTAPSRKTTLTVDSDCGDSPIDGVVVKATNSVSLNQMEYLPELEAEIKYETLGGTPKVPAEIPVLLLTQPEDGRWSEYYSIPDQIQITPEVTKAFHQLYAVRLNSEDIRLQRAEDVLNRDSLDLSNLRDAVLKADRHSTQPSLDDTGREQFLDNYASVVDYSEHITVRPTWVQTLEILASASARLDGRDTISEDDASMAIDIATSTLKTLETSPDTGEFDIDMIETSSSKSQHPPKKDTRDIIEEICDEKADEGEDKPMAEHDEVIERAKEEGLDINKVETDIQEMKIQGSLLEARKDAYIAS